MIARSIRLEAQLPSNLWPELIRTAAYLANRTPLRRFNYKTPYELVFALLPRLHHFRTIGCTAFIKDNKIKPTRKLDAQAQIGYMVGYSASIIFNIWIPHLRKIIRSRDVTFDESTMFDPSNPFLDQHIRYLIDLSLPDIEVPAAIVAQAQLEEIPLRDTPPMNDHATSPHHKKHTVPTSYQHNLNSNDNINLNNNKANNNFNYSYSYNANSKNSKND